jgi:probable rRNA maturation factor
MIKVNVILDNINWKNYLKNPSNFIKKKILFLNKQNKLYKKNILIFTLLLSGSKEIKNLNIKFRNKNKSTDVLSFPFLPLNILKFTKKKILYIGDIAISYEIINFRSKKSNFFLEFDKVWVHGLLHLIGYDHIKNKDFSKMNKIERKILNLIN